MSNTKRLEIKTTIDLVKECPHCDQINEDFPILYEGHPHCSFCGESLVYFLVYSDFN